MRNVKRVSVVLGFAAAMLRSLLDFGGRIVERDPQLDHDRTRLRGGGAQRAHERGRRLDRGGVDHDPLARLPARGNRGLLGDDGMSPQHNRPASSVPTRRRSQLSWGRRRRRDRHHRRRRCRFEVQGRLPLLGPAVAHVGRALMGTPAVHARDHSGHPNDGVRQGPRAGSRPHQHIPGDLDRF